MLFTIVTEDAFGEAVASYLRRKFTLKQTTLRQALQCDWLGGEHGLVIVCTDRPYYSAFEELADKLQKAKVPLTFACIRESTLVIGPLVVPGKSACYRCFQKRVLCLTDTTMMVEHVIRAALDRDWSLKSHGWLPTTPAMAAARLAGHVQLREDDYGRVALVSLIGTPGTQVQDFRIQKVHGCDCMPPAHTNNMSSDHLANLAENLLV
jgi:hypothetical protein